MKTTFSIAAALALFLPSCGTTTANGDHGTDGTGAGEVRNPVEDSYLIPGLPPIHPPMAPSR